MSISGLFQHPPKPNRRTGDESKLTPMLSVDAFELVEGKGIVGSRFYGKKRQVTILATETIQHYAEQLQTQILPGTLRSNIEITGIDLMAPLLERFGEDYDSKKVKAEMYTANIQLRIGTAVLRYYGAPAPSYFSFETKTALRGRFCLKTKITNFESHVGKWMLLRQAFKT